MKEMTQALKTTSQPVPQHDVDVASSRWKAKLTCSYVGPDKYKSIGTDEKTLYNKDNSVSIARLVAKSRINYAQALN